MKRNTLAHFTRTSLQLQCTYINLPSIQQLNHFKAVST